MIISFNPIIAIIIYLVIIKFVTWYKSKNNTIINIILDYLTGIIIILLSTAILPDNFTYSGHGGILMTILNFLYFTIIYIISTLFNRNKNFYLLPIFLYFLMVVYVFFNEIHQMFFIFPVFMSFFPLHFYSYYLKYLKK